MSKALQERIGDLLSQGGGFGEDLQVKETSKSWVFLTSDHVYKLKKQVCDNLQDLTNLRARHDNALTEIDLNRRLAPDAYLGAERVVEDALGNTALEGVGRTIDWLVKMRRLPASRMLDQMIAEETASETSLGVFVDMLASELVAFYRQAPQSNLKADELLTLLQDQHEQNYAVLMNPKFASHHAHFKTVLTAFDDRFERFFEVFAERVRAGAIVECHGDLRPEHICLTDPPVIFDCLEFNRNLRQLDPFSEIVFLSLECELIGAAWMRPLLVNAIKLNFHDHPPDKLLHFYEIIHALLRVRLCLAHLLVPVPRTPEKWEPLALRYLAIAERGLGLKVTPCGSAA